MMTLEQRVEVLEHILLLHKNYVQGRCSFAEELKDVLTTWPHNDMKTRIEMITILVERELK